MPNIDQYDNRLIKNSVPFDSKAENYKTLALLTQIFVSYINKQEKLDDSYSCEPIEDSNMNVVVRIGIDDQFWLVKHAEPWVRKYPDIPAPITRTKQEANFYEFFGTNLKLKGLMPEFLGFNAKENLLALEFIDQASSGMRFYHDENAKGLPENLLDQAVSYLARLHSLDTCDSIDWTNRDLRKLNHLHMFEFPFDPVNGLNLEQFCPGLSKLGKLFCHDEKLKRACSVIGSAYLDAQGPVILHGDFYPGSWLIKNHKMYVIDPEFCFCGPAEFDLGILLAHNLIVGASPNELNHWINHYCKLTKSSIIFDKKLCLKFCGVEILRRLLGAAQLPIKWPLERYELMLNLGREYCF